MRSRLKRASFDEVLVLDQEGAADAGGGGVLLFATGAPDSVVRVRVVSTRCDIGDLPCEWSAENCFRFVEPKFG